MMQLAGKRILLIITGGIAAYKSLQLIRDLQKAGATVQAILTAGARHFVTPLSVSTLTGTKTLTELFDLTQETEIGHIELSRSADLIVVAPATADFIAKMAQGRADDLASTTVLATDTDILVAPAMNVRMWQAAATQRNVETLTRDGVHIIGPDSGDMACGEFGPGRLSEPHEICDRIVSYFDNTPANHKTGALTGKHIIITSGPTREPIDPVRYISNVSSGKQGTAIANALAKAGAKVTFITGPADAPRPTNCEIIEIETAVQMHTAVSSSLPADGAVFCAAVADWRVAQTFDEKVKKDKSGAVPSLKLIENPDILSLISHLPSAQRPQYVVGFAAETQNLIANAQAKLSRKACDLILANDVSAENNVFGGDNTHIFAVTKSDTQDWQRLSKVEVGERLVSLFVDTLK